MHADDSRAHPPRFRVSLQLAVSLLLIGTAVAVGVVVGVYNYRQTSRIVLEAADDVFRRMGREVALELGRSAAPVRTLIDVLAQQRVAEASTLDERLAQLPAFIEALRKNPSLTALYVGYDDGGFYLVRPIRDEATRVALKAAADAAFVVQSIERMQSGTASVKFFDLRSDASRIDVVDRPDFAFDPRTRAWYLKAIVADDQVQTDPYVFFTTREPGITFARKARFGHGVVGADITLTNLSELLRNQHVAPSTELLLLTGSGLVVARNRPGSVARNDASLGGVRLAPMSETPDGVVTALAPRFGADAGARNFTFVAAGREWVGGFERLGNEAGAPLYLAIATPVDELLEGAQTIRSQSWLVTAALIAVALPLAWLAASRVSRPLRRLAGDARAIGAFDFTERRRVPSIVREVDQLGHAMHASTTTVRRFLDISEALAAERNLERLIARVLDETMLLARADAASIHLFDAKTRQLKPAHYVHRRGGGETSAIGSVAVDDAKQFAQPLARAVFDGRTVLVNVERDNREGRAWLGSEAQHIGNDHIGLLAVPLRDRAGEIQGVLTLLHGSIRVEDAQPQVVAFVEKLSGVAAIAIETRRLIAEQKALLEAFLQLLAAAIDAKSPYTGGHCQRVPELTKMLAQAACDARDGPYRDFALSEDEWEAVHIASWLHDCGKVTTPEYVVDKATKLETLCDRIHEVRTRFEVLKRDAEIAYWKACTAGGDEAALASRLHTELKGLDDDFAFVASCNEGGEAMVSDSVERLRRIALRTWQRTLDDRLGISWEERQRKERMPAAGLPTTESLLADKPEHVIERGPADLMPAGNPFGFKLTVPADRYDRGEIHNLTVGRGTLTEEERYKINDHVVQTIIMLEKLPFPRHLRNVPELAGGHHEKVDGGGYPRGLTKEQMSPVARMMAIADIFEALTAVDRPYKKGKTLSEAIQIMGLMRKDRHIDAQLFELFLVSGVYRRYAERYLKPQQIDDVDIAAYVALGAEV
ncbi:MAG TPA: HD domain-containing phosphohydrolase [Casimicrobiaceae bacterium]|nr:HD domain-containing phosphohydrolase [Casimicrobiaceae bacterium]